MRPIWKGHLRFSLVTIPIRVYNAVETADAISFNLLHKEDFGRVGYEKRCKKCGDKLEQKDIVKGFQYEKDEFVVIEEEDFKKVRLKATRIIEVQGFVDQSEIDPMLYENSYFAGPDGAVAGGPYALLAETLKKTNRAAVATVVLRDREDAVLVAPKDDALVMYRLRSPEELRKAQDVPGLDELKKVNAAELKLAETLVEQMTTTLSEVDLTDHYESALRDMIDAKVEGKEVVVSAEEELRPAVDIMAALKQSIEGAKGHRKPMEKARGKAAAKKVADEEEEKPARKTRRRKAS